MHQTPSTDNETLRHTSSYYITPGNGAGRCIPSMLRTSQPQQRRPFWQISRRRWRHHASVMGWIGGRQGFCGDHSVYPRNTPLWLARRIVCPPSAASLCVSMFTVPRTQPAGSNHWLIVTTMNQGKKKKKNTQSSGREASASAFVWIELSITGADRIKSYKGAVLKYTFSSPNEICQSCLSEEDLHTKLMQFTFAAEIQAQQRDSQCWLGSFWFTKWPPVTVNATQPQNSSDKSKWKEVPRVETHRECISLTAVTRCSLVTCVQRLCSSN